MRALGWWHAVPRATDDGKYAARHAQEHRSRWAMCLDSGNEPDLPAVDAALMPFIAWLFEAGPTSAGGPGQVTLTWADLAHWQDGTGIRLPPWKLRLLRRLSSEYLREYNQAGTVDAAPPWEREHMPKWKATQQALRALSRL